MSKIIKTTAGVGYYEREGYTHKDRNNMNKRMFSKKWNKQLHLSTVITVDDGKTIYAVRGVYSYGFEPDEQTIIVHLYDKHHIYKAGIPIEFITDITSVPASKGR